MTSKVEEVATASPAHFPYLNHRTQEEIMREEKHLLFGIKDRYRAACPRCSAGKLCYADHAF